MFDIININLTNLCYSYFYCCVYCTLKRLTLIKQYKSTLNKFKSKVDQSLVSIQRTYFLLVNPQRLFFTIANQFAKKKLKVLQIVNILRHQHNRQSLHGSSSEGYIFFDEASGNWEWGYWKLSDTVPKVCTSPRIWLSSPDHFSSWEWDKTMYCVWWPWNEVYYINGAIYTISWH